MDWLLSPTNYMVELVRAKQNGASGGLFEVYISFRQIGMHILSLKYNYNEFFLDR